MQRSTAIKILKGIVYAGIYGGLLMPLWFAPVVIFPFVFSKLTFFQVVVGLTFPAFLVLAWLEPKYRPRWSPLYIAFMAYFGAIALSTIFSVDPVRSWWGNQERMNGLFTLIHFLLWLTMTTSLVRTMEQWKRLINYQILLGVFMAVIALLQKPYPNLLKFPATERVGGLLDNPIYQGAYQIFILFFIAWMFVKNQRLGWRIWYGVAAILSMMAMIAAGSRGPFMGLLLGVVLAAATVGLLQKNKKIKAGVAALIVIGAVFYTTMVTVVVKLPAYQTFTADFPSAARIFDLNVGTAGRFIAWKIAWQGFLERPLTGWGFDAFHILFNKDYNPNSLRSGYYETWFDRAHNTVMDVLSMTGLFGILTFAAIWVLIYWTVIKARRKGYIDLTTTAILIGLPAGYFLQNLFVFDHPAAFSMSYLLYALVLSVGYPAFKEEDAPMTNKEKSNDISYLPFVINGVLLVIFAALLMSSDDWAFTYSYVVYILMIILWPLYILKKDHEGEDAARAKPMVWVSFGALQAVFLIIVYLTTIQPWRASYISINANNLFATGKFDEAFQMMKEAAAIQTPYLDEQTFLVGRNLMSIASSGQINNYPIWKDMFALLEDLNKRHLASHGMNAHPRYIYASVLQSLAGATRDQELFKMAEDQYKAAIQESPKRQQLYFALGRMYLDNGRVDEAIDLFTQAANFDAEIGEGWWNVGLGYAIGKQDDQKAAEYFIKSQEVEFPYLVTTAQDGLMLAQIYAEEGQNEKVKNIIMQLPQLQGGSANIYIQFAVVAEKAGLMEERNLIIQSLANQDQKLNARFQPLMNGTATSIQQSWEMTSGTVSAAPTSTKPAVSATSAPAQVATTSGEYKGPRK